MFKFRGVLLLLALQACGDTSGEQERDAGLPDATRSDGSSDPDGTVLDTLAPTLVSVSPLDFSTGVAVSTSIRVAFDEALAPETLTAANFILSPTTDVNIDYDASTFSVSISATGMWLAGTNYALDISGVSDLSGNIADDSSSSFATLNASALRVDGGGAATHASPEMAFNDVGHGVAVWTIGNDSLIAVSHYDAVAGTWSAETTYEDMGSSALVASNGTTFLVVGGGTSREISDAGATWTIGVPRSVGQSTLSNVISNGSSYLAYYSTTETASIYAAGTWSTTPLVVASTSDFSIVSDGVTYGATWVEAGESMISVYLNNAWGTPSPTTTTEADAVSSSLIVGKPSGNGFMIAYSQDRAGSIDSDNEIWSTLYSHNGSALFRDSPPQVVGTASFSSSDVSTVAANASGYFISWMDSGNVVAASWSSDAMTWNTDAALYDAIGIVSPSTLELAVDARRALLVFVERVGQDSTLRGIVFDGAAWDAVPTALSTGLGTVRSVSTTGFADQVVATNNRLATVWTSENRTARAVYGNAWNSGFLDTASVASADPIVVPTNIGLAMAWSQDADLSVVRGALAAESLVTNSYDGAVSKPLVRASQTGQRVAVWAQNIGHGERVFARIGRAEWGEIAEIGTIGSSIDSLQLATLGVQAAAAWSSDGEVHASYYDGSTWQSSFLLDSDGSNPQVEAFGDHFTFAWQRRIPTEEQDEYQIMARNLRDGVPENEVPVIAAIAVDSLQQFTLTAGATGLALTWAPEFFPASGWVALYDGSAWSAAAEFGDLNNASDSAIKVTASEVGFGILWISNVSTTLMFAEVVGTTLGTGEAVAAEVELSGLILASDGSDFLAIWDDAINSESFRALRSSSVWQSPQPLGFVADIRAVASDTGYLVTDFDDDTNAIRAAIYAGTSFTSQPIESTGEATLCELAAIGTNYAALFDVGQGPYSLNLRRYQEGNWTAPEALLGNQSNRINAPSLRNAVGQSLLLSWLSEDQLWAMTGLRY